MKAKTSQNTKRPSRRQMLGLFLVCVICVNVIGYQFFTRLDVTEDRVFSLSESTERLLTKIPQKVTVKFFFSRSLKEVPILVKTYATRVEAVLKEYAAKSRNQLSVEFVDPKPDSDAEESALQYGLNPGRLPTGEGIFFGAVFISQGRTVTIPSFDYRNEQFLEYELSEALVRLNTDQKTKVGILSNFNVLGTDLGFELPGISKPAWIFAAELRRRFEVVPLYSGLDRIENDIKVLLLLHPKNLPPATLYAIDQFVLRGGSLFVAVDPFSQLERNRHPSDPRHFNGKLPDVTSRLDKLFDAWDVQYYSDQVVGDLQAATRVQIANGTQGVSPFFLSLNKDNLNTKSPITAPLNHMLFVYPGAFTLKDKSPYRLEPLVETSVDSGTMENYLPSFIHQQELAKQVKGNGGKRVIAGLLQGKFKTAFPEGAPKPEKPNAAAQPLPAPIAESSAEGRILLVADTDFLVDDNTSLKTPQGDKIFVRPINDNLRFVMNAVEIMGGHEELISIRGRGQIARPFTRVQKLQKSAQVRWQREEAQLSQRIKELQTKLTELQAKKTQGNQFELSPEQVEEIKRFRAEEAKARSRLREVRKILREDIERLGNQLAFANLFFVPFGVTLFGFAFFRRRAVRARRR